jgi:hypothetical protein
LDRGLIRTTKGIIMEEDIKQVYEQWKNALIKTDVTTLEKLYTTNFLWTNPMGITCSKPENLFKIKCGNIQYISWVDEDMEIEIMTESATVKAREVLEMLVYEQKVSIVRNIIAGFQRQDDKWFLARIDERRNVS